MADKGKYIGDFEYGRCPYCGIYIGDFEYGRLPGIGYKHFPVLTIQSSPDTGATITVSPNDIYGNGNGVTTFERHYEPNTDVTLTAPASYAGKNFNQWTVDGVPQGGNPIIVTMSADKTAVAEYVEPPPAFVFPGVELLNVIIPKNRFWTAVYSYLDPNAEGIVIPRLYGEKANIVPVCIDTVTGEYKLVGHAIKEIVQVEVGNDLLVLDSDYTENLTLATIKLFTTPLLQSGGTYYFSVDATFPINGVDYLKTYYMAHADQTNPYVDGDRYSINGADVWSVHADEDLCFRLWFRINLSDGPPIVPWVEVNPEAGWNFENLRDVVARTRIGQSFKAPDYGVPVYLTGISMWFFTEGVPNGEMRVRIFSSINPEVQIGSGSLKLFRNTPGEGCGSTNTKDFFYETSGNWALREAGKSHVKVRAKGRMNPDTTLMINLADRVKDIMQEELNVPDTALDAAKFAALKIAKTETGALYMNTEIAFQQYLETEEVGQIWKMIPGLDRKFKPEYFAAGEPAGTLHLRDEDFVSFRMYKDLEAVRQICRIKYDHEPGGSTYQVNESKNAYPLFFYRNEETMEIDAYLKLTAEVNAVIADYLESLKEPFLTAVFEVKGHGFNWLPMDKVKLTRKRAIYANGELNGVLFRIFRIQKRLATKTTEITAILDSQVST